MVQLFANNAAGSLSSSINSSATTLALQTGEGALFPSPGASDYFYVTLQEGSTIEVVKCTARSGDSLTVVRGQQGTTAASFSATTTAVDLRVTKGLLEDINALATKTTDGRMTSRDYNRLNFRRQCFAFKEPGGTNIGYVGLKTWTLTGGASSDGLDGPLLVFQTAATTNDWKGVGLATHNQYRRDWLVRHAMRVQTGGNITQMRWHVGDYTANPQAAAGLAGAGIAGAGFRYDTAADGTAEWRAISSDAATETVTNTAVAFIASTAYDLLLEFDSTEVRFWINGSLVATHTSNVPGTSTLLGPEKTVTTLGNVARRLLWGRDVIDHL